MLDCRWVYESMVPGKGICLDGDRDFHNEA
jgi:hypothetical protein